MSGGYSMPFSSSPPATPPKGQGWNASSGNPFSFTNNSNLSTTPAGQPPSSAGSFTPAGPPPSSLFGSSQPRGESLFGDSHVKSPKSRSLKSPDKKMRSPRKSPKKDSNPFAALSNGGNKLPSAQNSPQRSLGQASNNDDYDEDEDDDYEPESSDEGSEEDYEDDASAEGYDDDEESAEGDIEMDEHEEEHTGQSFASDQNILKSSIPYDWMAHANAAEEPTPPRGIKRSHRGAPITQTALYKPGIQVPKKDQSVIYTIARDVPKQFEPAELEEPDDLILDTENNVAKTYPEEGQGQDAEELIEAALLIVPDALSRVWQNCCNRTKRYRPLEQEFTIGIGPRDDEPSFHKAAYVADLLFKLYHPPPTRGKQAFASMQSSRPSLGSFHPVSSAREEAYPKLLLDWLDVNHNPYQNALAGLKSHQPNPTAHVNFWDILFSAALRGKIQEIIHIFRTADFTFAQTSREDGLTNDGYDSKQLVTIDKVIRQVVEVLQSCPGVRDGDWFVTGNEWILFRRRVEKALQDLSSFAEGRGQESGPSVPSFEASHFGLKSTSTELTKSSRRAESRVPWTIYQNIKAFYRLLLGGTAELLSSAQDWLEATIALAVWWDGDDDEGIATVDFSMSRSVNRSTSQIARLVDTNTGVAYRKRLGAAYERVTNESIDDSLQVDSNNPLEIAIASIFEDDVEGVLGLLQLWSMPITAAVVEIASQGGWYESAPGNITANTGFNESDLMVLSYGQAGKPQNKDGILSHYADMLLTREKIEHSLTKQCKEGWELSLEVLGRLDDMSLANRKIGDTLGKLSVENDERADKLIDLCRTFGLDRDACIVSEKYANSVAENTHKYGTALIYYARAHNTKKVKDVLELLISYCLVQSASYPPVQALDPHLSSILSRPRDSLVWLADIDPKASDILSFQMSGYATLRKFYDIRDGDSNKSLRPAALKKAAAASVLAVIASAANNIQGGLYDENSPAVVPVDGLLVLLGEAMVFVDRPTRVLSLPQILVLLRAIEDLQTVHSRILTQCIECLTSTLATAQGTAAPADPRDLMKKSISDLTASTGFSLVGSSMLGSNNEGKGAEVKKRGWDWRKGLPEGAGAQEIISMLRIGLARDVSRAWVDGEEI